MGPFRLEAAMNHPSDRAEKWHKYIHILLLIELRSNNCITYVTIVTTHCLPTLHATLGYFILYMKLIILVEFL